MLITYRNHPVLRMLNEGKLGSVKVYESDFAALEEHKDMFRQIWHGLHKFYSKKIQCVSKTFAEAMISSAEKMVIPELIDKAESQSGTFIIGHMAICYNVINEGNGDFSLNMFVFEGDRQMAVINFSPVNGPWSWIANFYHTQFKGKAYIRLCQMLFTYLNFLKYAPIEVKEVGANKKVKDFHGKYCNQTDLDIEFIDSTWFTTLVKSDAFKVRGHFRLQNVGPGLTQKRLVWVTEHQRQGYIRNFKRPISIDD